MINKNMFYGEQTLNDYRDMNILDIMKEFLLSKGTRCRNLKGEVVETKHEVSSSDLVSSGLFVYGLKLNQTNKQAIK